LTPYGVGIGGRGGDDELEPPPPPPIPMPPLLANNVPAKATVKNMEPNHPTSPTKWNKRTLIMGIM
jgi:hypothetical protein